ncbi:PQQ-binding-like beta-propeller repeat protein [Pontiellaceae bacterium B12227]|nr:PQQ-binding-like beta-propeller repeat protein [Pontiellaceae bacterium B12227]
MKRVIVLLMSGMIVTAGADDWPQYGGVHRDNVSLETGLADSWPAEGPKVLWTAEVFDGYSGASVVGGKAYLTDRAGDISMLRCFDMKSGKELWKVTFDDPGKLKGGKFDGTRGTPTISDGRAYLVTSYGSFVCIDLKTQKVKWKHNLVEAYAMELHQFGIAQSPSLYGNMVLVAPNAPEVGVAAYDATSGERIWVSKGLGFHAYISPRVEKVCGEDMVIAVGSSEKAPKASRRKKGEPKPEPVDVSTLAPSHVVGLSPRNGSVLWDYTGWRCHGAIPHPVTLPDNRFFITGGYDAGSAMIQIVKTSGGFEPKELYKTDEVGSQLHQPIVVGDHLFIGSNSNSRKDGLASFSLDGKLVWRTKDIDNAPNFERGPFIMADGKLIYLDGKTGKLHLIKADPTKYTELASVDMVEKNDMAWAPLALSDGLLLVRDWNLMKCLDLR